MESLGRTFNPKLSTYKRDGAGRDSYISTNNGGFTSMLEKPRMSNFSPVKDYSRSLAPRLAGRAAIYRANGTGRDFYISLDSGGFQ